MDSEQLNGDVLRDLDAAEENVIDILRIAEQTAGAFSPVRDHTGQLLAVLSLHHLILEKSESMAYICTSCPSESFFVFALPYA